MKRDMDLLRLMLLRLEALHTKIGTVHIAHDDKDFRFEGYDAMVIAEHARLLSESRLIDAKVTGMGDIIFNSITWAGHDYISSVRDDEIWKSTKDTLSQAGGFTFDLAKALAKGLVKKQVERLTGVEINL